MIVIHIRRIVDYGRPEEGTFGRLQFEDFMCYTVEKPWANNEPRVSCIPPGNYSLERHISPKFGDCAIIYGGTVSKFPDVNYTRNLILIHPANRSSDLEGCIGLGNKFGELGGYRAVLNSRNTVRNFISRLSPNAIYPLKIFYAEY